MEERTFFDKLYEFKKYQLMQERLKWQNAVLMDKAQIERENEILSNCNTLRELTESLKEHIAEIKREIPEDILEEWIYSDYETYTDMYHHRCFWNEIENSMLVVMFLTTFRALYDKCVCISDDETADGDEPYNVRLYDFNDYDFYFKREEDMNAFIQKFSPEPCSVFEKHNGCWYELYFM